MSYRSFSDEQKNLAMECVAISETGGREDMWYRMSLASTGNSGLSFGPVQFDVSANSMARSIMTRIGLSAYEVQILASYKSGGEIEDLPDDVQEVRAIVDELLKKEENQKIVYDESVKFVGYGVSRVENLGGFDYKINSMMLMFLIDYHTQFEIDIDGKLHKWMQTLDYITAERFVDFKKTLLWASKPKGMRDINRRYNAVRNFCLSKGIWKEDVDKSDQHKSMDPEIDQMPEWLRV